MAGVDFKQIEAELREFGEVVDKKRFSKNPEVFIKKLNHLRARNKQQASPGRTTRSGLGSRVGDNTVRNGNDSDDDIDEDEEEEDSKRKTRRGVAVERSVTEKKTRRQTIHELPSIGRLSPSRKAGVPVPAGPIINRIDPDKPSTRRRTALHTPSSTRYFEDSDDFEEPVVSSKWSSSGLGTSVDPSPGWASAYQASSQLSVKNQPGSERSLFGINLPSFSRDKQDTSTSKEKSEKVLRSTRNRLAEFSDDEADYKAPEIADVGVNTSAKWQDSPISSDLNSSKSRIGFSGQFSRKDSASKVPLNRSFGTVDYNLTGHKSLYESTPSRVASSYTSSLPSDLTSKSDRRRLSRQWSAGASKAWINGQAVCSFVAKYLFVVPVVIFTVLIALYVNLKLQPSIDNSSGNFMACIGEQPEEDCLSDVQVKEIKSVIHKVLNILSKRAGDHDCAYSSQSRFMTVDEAMTNLKHENSSFTDAKRLLQIIRLNPDWKIRLLENDCATETKEINSVKCLESVRAMMGVICRLKLAIEQTFYRLCMIVIGIAIVGLMTLLVIKYRKYKAAKVKELHVLVDDIIGMLKNHANAYNQNRGESDIPPYIPVPHVRDALIPMKDRKKKKGLWNKAVKFLSDNESRVRKETHLIDGEETLCWKWLETYSDKVFNTGREQTRSSLTGLSTRPSSSCLKISNVLRDYSEDQLPEIRDAILERCGTYHGILHLSVDSSIKDCVYIKCVSEKAAGQNYKFLHGWWYDGRVVSVQYVGEGLYRSIFPDSAYAMVPLKSSKSRTNYGSGSPGRAEAAYMK